MLLWVPCLQLLAYYVIFAELSRKKRQHFFPPLPRLTNSVQAFDNKLRTTAELALPHNFNCTNTVGKVYFGVFMISHRRLIHRSGLLHAGRQSMAACALDAQGTDTSTLHHCSY